MATNHQKNKAKRLATKLIETVKEELSREDHPPLSTEAETHLEILFEEKILDTLES